MSQSNTSFPRPAAGAFVVHQGKVLLVQRGKEPAKGLWAIPGGKIHLGETIGQAAEREVFEETSVVIQSGKPIYTFDTITRSATGEILFHYVITDVIGTYVSGSPTPNDDAAACGWFDKEEAQELALTPSTRLFLEEFFF